jgi:hypothetical protein
MANLTENNDHFYGYKRSPKNTKGNPGGNIDMEFESINPYEFKKGMDVELNKMGVLSLREANEDEREKATESAIKNLKDCGAYYSYMEHYETKTRNMDKKPSFKTFLKELEGFSMKEVKEKFTEDKMKELKLKENIRAEVRNKINELFKGGKIEEGVVGQTFRKIFGKQEYKEGDIVFLKKNHREVRVILQAKRGDKSKRNRLDYRTQDEKSNLADPEGNIYYIMSEPQPINVKLTIDNAGIDFEKLDSLSKTGYREGGEKIYQTSIKGEAVWDEGKKRYMPK